MTEYQAADLPSLGWIRILWVGEENIYFVHGGAYAGAPTAGLRGFCKVAS